MIPGEFAAIEARVEAEGLTWAIDALEDRAALLAAVRERDNTIAKVQELLREAEISSPDENPYVYADELRAALDPQETP